MAANSELAALRGARRWGVAPWLMQLPTFAVLLTGAVLLVSDAPVSVASALALTLAASGCAGLVGWLVAHRLLRQPLERLSRLVDIEVAGPAPRALAQVVERVAESVRIGTERKELLDSIVAAVPGCVYRLVPEEPARPLAVRMLLVSAGLEAATRLRHDDLTDTGVVRWIVEADRPKVFEALGRHIAEQTPWLIEYRVRSPAGKVTWVRDHGVGTYDATGRLLHVDGVLMNATASILQTRTSEMLRAALERSSSEVLLVRPGDLRVSYANAGARHNLCLEPVGHALPTLVDRSESELRELAARVLDGAESGVHWRCIRGDGSSYPIEGTMVVVGEDDERGLLIVAVNVEERERHEQSLRESEERLRLMVEASQDGIFDIDLRRQLMFVSAQTAHILGMPREQTGMLPFDHERVLELVHPDDRAMVLGAFEAYAARTQATVDCEPRVRGRGGYRWVRARGRGEWDKQNTLVRLTVCLSDVTQHRVSQTILRDTVSRLGAVLEHVAEGIITFDSAGLIRSFNPAAERIFDWPQEEILDRPVDILVPVPRGDDAWDVAYGRLQRGADAIGVRRGGARMPVEIGVTRLVAAGQELYTAIVRDVSERKRVEEELRAARDAAESSLRAKSEFLAVMSHEIRTPLNGVLGMAQLLGESQLTGDQRETVRMIHRSGEALLSIINDVLDYSKIEAGHMQVEQVPFCLREVVREVFDLVGVRVRDQAIELVLDYERAVPRRVVGDAARLRQILLNLVGNAVKFTERGHVVVSVRTLAQSSTATTLEIAVEDSGIGIDPAVQSRLFTAFTQADASTTRRFGGTGLGLAICKQLTDLMGGEIDLRSVAGVGSVFTLKLTFGRPLADAETAAQLQRSALSSRAGVAPNVRLLLPYRRLRSVVERDLGALGCRVERVQSMEELWQGAERDMLFLVDRAVLGLDAAGFAHTVRGTGRRVVLLTPPFGDGDRAELRELGFAAVLAKPVGVDDLADALAACEKTPAAPAAAQLVTELVGARLRVLVADDNAVNQRVAMRMLERLGCEVVLADDGDAALRCWRERLPDLVLMDVRMPVMDGIAATEAIRTEERSTAKPRTPIVGISANSSHEDEQRCRAAGMDDFVPKPIRTSGLERVIGSLRDVSAASGGDATQARALPH